jgi:hypothetical protein
MDCSGVQLDVHWGLVERSPGAYSWSGYSQLMRLILDLGFKLKVSLCFNSSDSVPLPAWVREIGKHTPDIWYTDRQGYRSQEYLTLGVDHGKHCVRAEFSHSARELLPCYTPPPYLHACPLHMQYL